MANLARAEQEKRVVHVNRQELVKTLRSNKEKHVQEYKAAMAGYKAALLSKTEAAFAAARRDIEVAYVKAKNRVDALTDADIAKQRDSFVLLDAICVDMKVPRSYEEDYAAAIDMAEADVRETLELSYAEFTCFVRDKWEWKSNFEAISMMYGAFA